MQTCQSCCSGSTLQQGLIVGRCLAAQSACSLVSSGSRNRSGCTKKSAFGMGSVSARANRRDALSQGQGMAPGLRSASQMKSIFNCHVLANELSTFLANKFARRRASAAWRNQRLPQWVRACCPDP
jgi:hypothetical protein